MLVLDTDTVGDVADKIAYHTVGRWVSPRDAAMVVSVNGRALPSDATVTEAGITPMQAVTVGWAR
ncbi:hypothetical protein GCM10009535_56860 [Streptomyces thermocarboxydovorans]|uniref:Uncharacterized protein n=1 Tax=Streptomyces thermocarboxydovorans TaxID=59298 RepID=A0ABN1HVL1_9ACTN